MPLDPSISLQTRGIDLKPFDPTATLVTVAQLRDLQSKEQLRQLQMAEVGQGLQEYQRLQNVLQAQQQGQAGQPAMVPGGQLAAVAPGVAPAADGQPLYSVGMRRVDQGQSAPVAPGVTPPSDEQPRLSVGMRRVDQGQPLPTTLDTGYAQPTQSGALRPSAPGGSPAPGAPSPQAPAPQAGQPPPQQQAVPGDGLPSIEEIQQRAQRHYAIASVGPRFGVPMAKELMGIDTNELNNRLAIQKGRFEAMQKSAELLAGINDQTGLDEARPVLAAMGSPLARTLGADFNAPQTQAQLAYYRTIAQTQQQRMQDKLKADENAVAWFGNEAKMLEARVNAARLPLEQQRALTEQQRASTEQARLGEVEWKQDASGNWFPVRKNPEANTGPLGGGNVPGVGAPAVNPASKQPYVGMEAMQRRHEWEQGIGNQYLQQAQPMKEAALAMGTVRNSLTPEQGQENANDVGLVTNFIKLLNPATARDIQEGKATDFSRLGSIGDRLSRLWTKVTQGGALEPEDRKYLGDYAEKVYGQYSEDYQKNLLEPTRERAKQKGLNPELTVLDVRTTATKARVVTQADVMATMKDTGRSRDEVLAAFKRKGYRVVGAP